MHSLPRRRLATSRGALASDHSEVPVSRYADVLLVTRRGAVLGRAATGPYQTMKPHPPGLSRTTTPSGTTRGCEWTYLRAGDRAARNNPRRAGYTDSHGPPHQKAAT